MRFPSPKHLVFDFNGTLLDDNEARLRALNESLAVLGLSPIDMAQYRKTFCVPVPLFYSRLIGRALTEREWELADGVFQDKYLDHARTGASLMKDAHEALSTWSAMGNTQSLLSLHAHNALVEEVERLGISEYFSVIEGRRGPTGGSKATAMHRHLGRLSAPSSNVVVIGDTQDDAKAAAEAGVQAVLFSGGAQLGRDLERTGVPVVDTLTEAVECASRLLDGVATGSARGDHVTAESHTAAGGF